MEGQSAKRRRVYSLEPRKVVQSMFTRNYVNYLVPALMKIKETSSTSSAEEDCRECDDLKNVVKYEVDMAMAFSAQGFAWSHGLKAKLQKDHHHHYHGVNAATSTTTTSTTGEGSSSKIHNHSEMVPEKNIPESMNNKEFGSGEDVNEDDEMMKRQLRSLRRLVPGGEEMCDDEQMVTELESYISCLQMQVNVLQCLLAQTP